MNSSQTIRDPRGEQLGVFPGPVENDSLGTQVGCSGLHSHATVERLLKCGGACVDS